MSDQRIKVVTFYSYKGGSGRTVCAANFAGLLANKLDASSKKPILLVDMDLDSAGLTILLKKYDHFNERSWNSSRVVSGDLDLNFLEEREDLFSKGLLDVSKELGLKGKENAIRFLGGEVTSGRSAPDGKETAKLLRELLDYLEEEGFCAVIVDSASGRQDIARAWHMVSPVMIYCCRLTEQFLYGTERQIRDVLNQDGIPPDIIIQPMAVPNLPSETESYKPDKIRYNSEARYKFAIGRLRALKPYAKKSEIRLLDGINEVERFKWEETVLVGMSKLLDDEIQALKGLENLVNEVINLWSNRLK